MDSSESDVSEIYGEESDEDDPMVIAQMAGEIPWDEDRLSTNVAPWGRPALEVGRHLYKDLINMIVNPDIETRSWTDDTIDIVPPHLKEQLRMIPQSAVPTYTNPFSDGFECFEKWSPKQSLQAMEILKEEIDENSNLTLISVNEDDSGPVHGNWLYELGVEDAQILYDSLEHDLELAERDVNLLFTQSHDNLPKSPMRPRKLNFGQNDQIVPSYDASPNSPQTRKRTSNFLDMTRGQNNFNQIDDFTVPEVPSKEYGDEPDRMKKFRIDYDTESFNDGFREDALRREFGVEPLESPTFLSYL